MNTRQLLLRATTALLFISVAMSVSVTSEGDHQELSLGNFQLESGTTLPDARLAYVTYGTLNATRTNAVLLPSWYGGDHHG